MATGMMNGLTIGKWNKYAESWYIGVNFSCLSCMPSNCRIGDEISKLLGDSFDSAERLQSSFIERAG